MIPKLTACLLAAMFCGAEGSSGSPASGPPASAQDPVAQSGTVRAASAQSDSLRIVFIGDSITDGNWGGGGAAPSAERNHRDQNHLYGSGYMYLCAAHYGGRYPERGFVFFNRGVSGNTLGDLAARWEEDALALRPDVLSVLVGVNDVHRDISAFDIAEWESDYRRLLDRAQEQNPGVRLVLGTPFTTRPELREAVGECALAVERIAGDYGAVFLPFGELFEGLIARYPEAPASHWLWDGIHPTAAGHQRMAEMWIARVGIER